ncbi:MAG: RsmB/NOP family class I SAM-dependent RNA methyltransferase [Verrucomicrobiota bacterium]|nr:RsmB/NOP family class I SAM-dependent RNA methyltransferase [Verrucomicrobiota bacterium]
MRSIKLSLSSKSIMGWDAAVYLVEAYLVGDQKADQLLDQLPEKFVGERRAACQSLFLGALRHGHRTRAALEGLLRKKTKSRVEAILLVAGYEMFDAEADRHPKIVHHAVERSKQLVNSFERGFLNAILRKLPSALEQINAQKSSAAFYSHPGWLVERWQEEFPGVCTQLLEWNQGIPPTYLKVFNDEVQIPLGLEATEWPQFYKITGNISWKENLHPLLKKGNAYVKDPSTRIAPALLRPRAGESVLDLCAAPGGKAYDMAYTMQGKGQIVAVDLPGKRIARLEENLSLLRSEDLKCVIVECDLLEMDTTTLKDLSLPTAYDAVMLDAPCSNTGVIQRRTDVKWRLQPKDIENCAKLQLQLLHSAARFVKTGGRITYSTCSIEAAENQLVVDAFLASKSGRVFNLEKAMVSLPWETNHDGAGAFLMRRKA